MSDESVVLPLLIAARLAVRSSYGQDREEPADDLFDTVQFHIAGNGAATYRIRTYAIDHDIHVHRLGPSADHEFVQAHLARAYGDVIASVHTVPIRHRSTEDLVDAGVVVGHLEVAPGAGFAFWNPDGGTYATLSQPVDPDERRGMKEIVYLGGIARFWLPESWQVDVTPTDGGCFYHPEGEGTLRLSVLTFDTSTATGQAETRRPRKPSERHIDAGRLPNGCELAVYDTDYAEDGEPSRSRYWEITQLLPGQCRTYLFSYAYAISVEDDVAGELAMVDRELRRMIPHPDPV